MLCKKNDDRKPGSHFYRLRSCFKRLLFISLPQESILSQCNPTVVDVKLLYIVCQILLAMVSIHNIAEKVNRKTIIFFTLFHTTPRVDLKSVNFFSVSLDFYINK